MFTRKKRFEIDKKFILVKGYSKKQSFEKKRQSVNTRMTIIVFRLATTCNTLMHRNSLSKWKVQNKYNRYNIWKNNKPWGGKEFTDSNKVDSKTQTRQNEFSLSMFSVPQRDNENNWQHSKNVEPIEQVFNVFQNSFTRVLGGQKVLIQFKRVA